MGKKVDCECGVTVTGEDDDAIYENVRKHATEVHDMEITRDQALAMARPA